MEKIKESKLIERIAKLSNDLMSVANLNEIMSQTSKAIVDIFEIDHCGIVVFNYNQGGKVIAEYPFEYNFIGKNISIQDSPIQKKIVQNKKIIKILDINQNISLGNKVNRLLKSKGIISIVIVPMVINNKTVASFSLDTKYKRTYSKSEIQFCQLIANQVALTIRKNDLIDELTCISKVGEEILFKHSIDFSDISEIIKKSSQRLINDGNFYIAKYNDIENSYEIIYLKDTQKSAYKVNASELKYGLTEYTRQIGTTQLLKEKDIKKLHHLGKIKIVGPKAKVWMGAPLIAGDKTFGVIAAQNYDNENYYDDYDKNILSTIASQISIAYYNSQLVKSEVKEREKAESLLEIAKSISTDLTLESAANIILDQISNVVEYKKATVQLFDGDYRRILTYRGYSNYENSANLLVSNNNDNIIQRILNSKDYKPIVIANTNIDPDRANPIFIKDIHSFIGFPLLHQKKVKGVITLGHNKINFYNDQHATSLLHFTYQASIAINNAGLEKNRMAEIKSIEFIAESLNRKIDINEILESIVKIIKENLTCAHCAIFLPHCENDQIILKPFVKHGEDTDSIKSRTFIVNSMEEGLAGYVFRTGKPIIEADPRQNESFSNFRVVTNETTAMIVVPILLGHKRIGVICANHEKGKKFDDHSLFFMQNIANYAAIAIERSLELDKVLKVGTELNKKDTINDALSLTLKTANEITSTRHAVIYIIDRSYKIIESSKLPKNINYPKPELEVENNLTRKIIETKDLIVIDDIKHDNLLHFPYVTKFHSLIGVPLVTLSDNYGVLYVFDEKLHFFSDTEKSMLKILAEQTASALSQIFKKRELTTLNEIGKISVDQENKLIAFDIYKKINKLINFNDFFIFLYNVNDNNGEYIFWLGDGKKLNDEILKNIKYEKDTLTYQVIKSKDYLLINNWEDEKDKLNLKTKIVTRLNKSWLGVPLLMGKEVIGVISIQSKIHDAFNNYTVNLLKIIANQAAFVFKNRSLIKEVKLQSALQITAINQISKSIAASSLGLVEIMEEILKWLKKISISKNCESEIGIFLNETNEIEILSLNESEIEKKFISQNIINKKIINKLINGKIVFINKNNAIYSGSNIIYKPLHIGNDVFGYFKLENFDRNNSDQNELLESISGLAIVAVQIGKLYKDIIVRDEFLTKESWALDLVHRFRNIVGTVPIWVQFINEKLKDHIELAHEINPYIKGINDDINNLIEFIDQISLRTPISKQNMNFILNSLINYINVLTISKKNFYLVANIQKQLFPIFARPLDMVTALTNIVDNAIESMHHGGTLTINAKNIRINKNKFILISIEDEGIGIKKQNLRNIFSPLFSTKGKGHGYGLWRSKILIEKLRGSINIESKLSSGTKFIIKIPV